MKELKELRIKEDGERRFYYVDFGSEYHGRTSFRLWVHPALITWQDEKPYLEVPKKGISLVMGQKSFTWILRLGKENLFNIYVPCGYRGGASFEAISPVSKIASYSVYRSPVGSCGISKGALITTFEEEVVYKWGRNGRLYGSPPSGTSKIDIEGNYVDFEETDICEIEDLAEVKG